MEIAVIGAGSWGTAIAHLLGSSGHRVSLVARSDEVARHINEFHANPNYLKGAELSENVFATASAEEALRSAECAAIAAPSSFLRDTAETIEPYVRESLPLINCSKGVEAATGKLASQIFEEVLGNASRIAALSGPTHAEEVVKDIPSAAVCASASEATAAFFADVFAAPAFRTYTSTDIVGVELCGAFKNVIAIAVGISYGIGNGDNTAAMLMTRGVAEMSRMVVACGGDAITCMGLAGCGDMIVTCMSQHSRNRRFGQFYAACGKSLADFEADTHMVVEGAVACRTLETLEQRFGVELPITDSVRRIVWEGADPCVEERFLTMRPLVGEFYGI